jgi:hypothetical protein
MELDEARRMDFDQMVKKQNKFKGTIDHKARLRGFNKGDLVLMWDKRREKSRMHQKFDNLWLGPDNMEERFGSNYLYFFIA